MHELSLVAALLQECQRRAGDAPVSLVRVRCAATVPDAAVREAFRLLTADGPLSAARLEVEPLEMALRCPCGFSGPLQAPEVVGHLTVCPSCGAVAVHVPTAGLELLEVVQVCLGAVGHITKVWTEGEVPMALVRTGNQEARVCLLYVPDAGEGDHVLVHLGMAVELLDPTEAAATLALRQAADTNPHQEEPT